MSELEEFKEDILRAANAAQYSMDYFLLHIILKISEQARQAYRENNHKLCLYTINQGLWEIGIYIQNKIKKYTS